jgi:2-amino-4-hydroxy-6-hydroxymethyldihydropteridine diphosphokinase
MASSLQPVGLALGSNLGDRWSHLRAARDFLAAWHEGDGPPAVSPVYETEPVDCPPDSAPFLNAVMEIVSSLDPEELLARADTFERRLGRDATRERNAPRPIDIDILYAGDREIRDTAFEVPHPRLTRRRFVLQPLAEIRPRLVLPGQTLNVAELLALLPAAPAVRQVAAAW